MPSLRQIASDEATDPVLKVIGKTAPAVATDFTYTVPGESVWQLVAVTAKLVTDGTGANRTPSFTVTDGTATLFQLPIGVAITATLTTQVSWIYGSAFTNTSLTGAKLGVALPKLLLPAGFTFGPVTTNIQAGDQWSIINATVYEVFRGDIEHERAIQARILDRLIAVADLLDPSVLTLR